ncbi:hypothetical protein ASG01_13450 [Chryseobacterium sp. Leaf180]|uniref:hypothetical protein n=1 Tax=Chryseobacterium sp. Leaf180 TaxID=1736289 RepID=UPI00070121CD|nr:hypothetical protein [Chryseobacterium sp. Leaf180]KQR91998.1 hypothetical protein ASG01_13450 [Chryseobacterium sp. Leaf180]
MSRDNLIYSLSNGYSPYIRKDENGLKYCFPVSSGHVDKDFEFFITDEDLDILRSSDYRFKLFYLVLFFEAQSTFGTGNRNPRTYKIEEFEKAKAIVLYQSESELHKYLLKFCKKYNLGDHYFQSFSKSVFEK